MAANKISPTQRALNLWAIILIIWAIYRANLKMPEWFDELIAKPLVFVLPVYWYIKNIDKKDLFSSLYIKPKLFFQDLIYGVFIGGIFFLTAIFANFLKSGELFKINNAINSQNIALII